MTGRTTQSATLHNGISPFKARSDQRLLPPREVAACPGLCTRPPSSRESFDALQQPGTNHPRTLIDLQRSSHCAPGLHAGSSTVASRFARLGICRREFAVSVSRLASPNCRCRLRSSLPKRSSLLRVLVCKRALARPLHKRLLICHISCFGQFAATT